jgi:FixJ family two-component response regulator
VNQIPPLIAVLDDEPKMCKAVARLLKTHGFQVVTFTLGEDLLAACAVRLPECLLLDLHMAGIDGFEVLERFAAQHVPIPVIVITGHDQPGNAERVQSLGAVSYLLKPLDESKLLAVIHTTLSEQRFGSPTAILTLRDE